MVDFDDLQSSWDDTEGVDDKLLDKVAEQVVNNHRRMKSVLDGRDLRELIASLVVAIAFGCFAWSAENFYIRLGSIIVVGACIEISAVLLWARRGIQVAANQLSIRDFTVHQRRLVRRQIRLLRHVAWWYLLPILIGLLVMTYGFGNLYFAVTYGAMVLLMFAWIWKLNQDAVAQQLQPLEAAYTVTLESLDRPEEEFLNRSYEALANSDRRRCSKSAILKLFVFLVSLAIVFMAIGWWLDDRESYPKLAPFAAVRWHDDRPEVQVGGNWYELVKIDNVTAAEIVEYCEWRYLGKSRKRFEEDLFEVLTRMGYPPGETSTLTVKERSTGETVVLENVAWTPENRSAIKRRNDRSDED